MGNKLCAPLLKRGYRNDTSYPWNVRKDSHLLRLWADVFKVHGDGEYMRWQRVSDDVVPINISCIEDTPSTVFQITAYNRQVEKIFDVKITQPGTIICPATESFVHWRDPVNQCEWGLNFSTATDAHRFRDCCAFPTQRFARKASSTSSLRLSPPKRVKSKGASASSPSSPLNQQRPFSADQHSETCDHLDHVAPSCNALDRNIPEFSSFLPDDNCDRGGFRYSAIIKPPSDASIYDNENGTVFTKSTKEADNRKSMPSCPTTYPSPARSLQGRPASAVSAMTFAKEGTGSLGDLNGKIYVTTGEARFPVEKDQRLKDNVHIETAFVGGNQLSPHNSRPVSRLTVDTNISVSGGSRHTSSSESPEWPSPPEPLTPITPLNPEYDIQFDSITIQKMLRSLPSSPVEKDRDMGFHDESVDSVGYNGSRRRSSGLSRTRSLNVHDRNNKPAVPVRHRTTQITLPETSPYVSTQALQAIHAPKSKLLTKVLVEQELLLRNQCAQHSYPDSGIGGMTCDTSGSLLSEDSNKSEVSKTGVEANNDLRAGSSGASSRASRQSDIINQLGEGGEYKQDLGELSEEDVESDGSIDTMTETDSQLSYARQVGAIRKAGWLVVKNWLVHKKRKIELAPKRNWKRYWICLKGTTLLFFECDEESAVNENSVPRHILVIEGGISQAVPEHPKRDNIFSLSTACGDAFLLQAASQIDLENWIRSIHSACASSFARQHGKDNTLKLLKSELNRLDSNVDTDVKMKKMAELQMTVVSDPRSRMAIVKQIAQWEENLEKLYLEQYRFRCYIASLQGTELPNPKVLLANAAKPTKATLGRLGIFTVTSFHALVCARKPLVLPNIYGKGSKKGGLLSPRAETATKPRIHTPTGLITPGIDAVVKTNERILSESADNLLDKNSDGSSGHESLSRITLPNKQSYDFQTILVGVDKQTAVKDLLESVCNKRQLNPRDHYVRIKPVGSQDDRFIVPDRHESIKRLKYDAIEVCQKSIFQLELTKTSKDGVFGFAVEAELAEDFDRDDELQVYVCDVTKGSVADKHGLIVGDEILVINSKIVSELDMVYIETLLHESRTLFLTVRSFRTQPPTSDFITQHADAYISNMVCPPPPSQSRISEKIIGNLIVPAPVNTETGEDTESSKHSSPSKSSQDKSSQEISSDQIDALLKGAEQVTAICRDPNSKAEVIERPVTPRPLSDAQRMRKVIMELIETERAYVKDLNCLTERYLEPLREETFLTSNEISQLFGNIQEIVVFQQQFLQSLEEAIDLENEFFITDDTKIFRRVLFSLGGSFLYYANHFKVYSSFCASHSRSQKLLNPESNKALKEFLKSRNPKQQHSATLESFLIKPIQRILKYPLLLQQLVNMSQPDTDEHHHLSEALRGMEAVAEHINEMQKIYEEYGSIFDDLSTTFKQVHPTKQPVDLSVGELQMYGTVEWCNMTEYLGKIKKSTDFENIAFVFRTAVVFLCREKVKRSRKSKSLSSKPYAESDMLERFRTLIPTHEVQVRMGKVADIDRHYWWDLVHSRSDPDNRPERFYQFCNSTAEAKADFVKVIRHTIRESVRRMMIPTNKPVTKTVHGSPDGGTKEPLPNPLLLNKRRSNKSQDPERHSVDLEEKFSSLDYDNLFRTRSKTIGDLNEAGIDDNSTFITASEPQISAQNPSPNSSNSNLSSSNSGSAKLLFASANPLSYSSSSVNSGGSPVWKPRAEIITQPGNQLLPPIISTVTSDKVTGKPPTGSDGSRKDTKTVVFATPPFPVYKDTEC
ncbi:protein still life, isoform SIF type 1 isoform X3 [Patella vulgata]|uniref:protein still life, isoform SIF type 1 isoform X3 n=1 Tax=Patella vulgata TaxID=6465 RepID=UPI0021800FFF|nr:protein still life, isoform SIF type 1 isoform X3 [Patella vulgata]